MSVGEPAPYLRLITPACSSHYPCLLVPTTPRARPPGQAASQQGPRHARHRFIASQMRPRAGLQRRTFPAARASRHALARAALDLLLVGPSEQRAKRPPLDHVCGAGGCVRGVGRAAACPQGPLQVLRGGGGACRAAALPGSALTPFPPRAGPPSHHVPTHTPAHQIRRAEGRCEGGGKGNRGGRMQGPTGRAQRPRHIFERVYVGSTAGHAHGAPRRPRGGAQQKRLPRGRRRGRLGGRLFMGS